MLSWWQNLDPIKILQEPISEIKFNAVVYFSKLNCVSVRSSVVKQFRDVKHISECSPVSSHFISIFVVISKGSVQTTCH